MKHIIFTGTLVLASAMAGEAMADCSTNQVINLNGLLSGNTVCDATATYDTSKPEHPTSGIKVMGIQEEHRTGGQLWDYKKGSDDPIDPTKQVGTWSVASNCSPGATVSYIYTGPPATAAIPYNVYSTGSGGYDFCTVGGPKVASVTIVPGMNGCGSSGQVVVPECATGTPGIQAIADIQDKDKQGKDKKDKDKQDKDWKDKLDKQYKDWKDKQDKDKKDRQGN